MNLQTKKVMYIDLSKGTSEVKFHEDYGKYIGGVGLGLKLLTALKDKNPIVIATGPLNGFFPYMSKTAFVTKSGVEPRQYFLGGSLSLRLRFTGIDALVITGVTTESKSLDITDEKLSIKAANVDEGSLGLPGKRSVISVEMDKVLVDGYFESGHVGLVEAFMQKGISSVVITGTKTFEIRNLAKYQDIYKQLLLREEELDTKKNGNPSCSGCPLGCEDSKIGEIEGDLLVHSLVGCKYAESIYKDINTVFSCFNMMGYSYTHEDLENFSKLVYDLLEELREK